MSDAHARQDAPQPGDVTIAKLDVTGIDEGTTNAIYCAPTAHKHHYGRYSILASVTAQEHYSYLPIICLFEGS